MATTTIPTLAANQSSAPTSGAERRRSARLPHAAPAWLSSDRAAISTSPAQQVHTVDVSQHGVGFRSNSAIDEGDVLCIQIGRGPRQMLSQVRIVRTREDDDGTFQVGAEFC